MIFILLYYILYYLILTIDALKWNSFLNTQRVYSLAWKQKLDFHEVFGDNIITSDDALLFDEHLKDITKITYFTWQS